MAPRKTISNPPPEIPIVFEEDTIRRRFEQLLTKNFVVEEANPKQKNESEIYIIRYAVGLSIPISAKGIFYPPLTDNVVDLSNIEFSDEVICYYTYRKDGDPPFMNISPNKTTLIRTDDTGDIIESAKPRMQNPSSMNSPAVENTQPAQNIQSVEIGQSAEQAVHVEDSLEPWKTLFLRKFRSTLRKSKLYKRLRRPRRNERIREGQVSQGVDVGETHAAAAQ